MHTYRIPSPSLQHSVTILYVLAVLGIYSHLTSFSTKGKCCRVSAVFILYVYITTSFNLTVTVSAEPVNSHPFPGLTVTKYSKPGDVNIGAVLLVTEPSSSHPAEGCSNTLRCPQCIIEETEGVVFAVDQINRNPDLLPNITLGFVILGSCQSVGATLATSLQFLPHGTLNLSGTLCPTEDDDWWHNYDVIGIVSPGFSSLSTPLSSLYAVAKVPIVGPTETSDEFSDKKKHPYFFRVSTPDVYLVKGILNFLSSNHWTYVSVLYADDVFGQNAFNKMQHHAIHFGMCIATSQRVGHFTNFEAVVENLIANYRARVVVVFLLEDLYKKLQLVISSKDVAGYFIFVGQPGQYHLTSVFQGNDTDRHPAAGTITFDLYNSVRNDAFPDHIKETNVKTSDNPWMKTVLENLNGCSFNNGTCKPGMGMIENEDDKYSYIAAPFYIDSVLALAHAAHDLLKERCPSARGVEARECITHELIREYLKDTTVKGFSGDIEFDENQDVKGKYAISQLVYGSLGKKSLEYKIIGIYDSLKDTISYVNNTAVSWLYFNTIGDTPESVCSRPCVVGEYKIEKKVPCCWECKRCRENERLVQGNTSCEVCPEYMWPDPSSAFTTCIDIPLTYPKLDETIPIVLLSLTLLALVVYGIVTISYIIYRDERVIKASSRELSVIQLVAIFGGYINVILFQIEPTKITCTFVFFLFSVTFVTLYSPLLVKTIRIFRIFQSGKTNKQNLRFISTGSQLVFAIFLISVQVAFSVTIYIIFSPGVKRTQPIWSEKFVELSCDLTLPGLTSFLGYNIVLVSFCSAFAFKTRKLPDNFNESQFISMCVATTLLIWLAFIPTYFTADREFVRVFLLSVALLLNHSVALIFLFIPKIHAAIYLPSCTITGKIKA